MTRSMGMTHFTPESLPTCCKLSGVAPPQHVVSGCAERHVFGFRIQTNASFSFTLYLDGLHSLLSSLGTALMRITSLTIMAHGAAQETFLRHVELWGAITPNVLVICPATDKMKECRFPIIYYGQHCHAGRSSVERLKAALGNIAKHQDNGYHLICEYDSFLLSPDVVPRKGLIGPLMQNFEPCRFIAPRYPNPPWMLDYRSARLMMEAAYQWPDVWEEGFADRYLAALAVLAGVPILD